MVAEAEKRAEVRRAEERMAYFERMQRERPRLRGIWTYWWHWWRMHRIYWLSDLWLQQVRKWKKEVTRWERPGVTPDLARATVIRKNVKVIEDGLTVVVREEDDTEKIAREHKWRVRWPTPHRTMTSWIGAKRRRITRIRHWIKEILKELPRLLHRIKIRLYNMQRRPTPTGMFQGFFDIDALIDPETELINWDWWLTKEEIAIAKYHFVGYFKGMAKWRSPGDVDLAYFDESKGIPHAGERVRYGKYQKNIPLAYITKAQTLTVKELIVGESSKVPEPNPEPTSENMGVFVQRFMVIDEDGGIKWDEIRNKWAYHPTAAMVERVKGELGLA